MIPLSPLRRNFLPAVIVFAWLATCVMPAPLLAGTAEDVRAFTGAPTRVVWIQDAGDTANVYSERPTIRLMVFDTEDGKGERALLPDIGWYAKPVITADGNRVVFSDLTTKTVDVVNWDGTGRRQVVKNVTSFEGNDTWTDPKTGTVWVYAQVTEQRGGQEVPVIRRYQLDHSELSELVWDKLPMFHFQVSGDGRVACGGGDGGNTPQGILTLPNGTFTQHAGGCWPSMSPDGSHRMWVFTGNHRSIHFCVPVNRSGNAAVTNVRFEGPGLEIKPNEEMYHPRWSNNIRYVGITSPYSDRHYSHPTDGSIPVPNISNEVAAKVEVYIGKFKEDFSGIERWVQVTHNTRGDYWPAVWIKPSKAAQAALAAAPEAPEEKAPATLDTKGLVYVWQTGGVGNQINDPVTGAIHQCSGQFRNDARYGRYFVMDLTDGAYVPDGSFAAPLLAACKAGNQFAMETEITHTGAQTPDEKVVMAFADDPAAANFILTQYGDSLILRLKTDAPGASAQPIRICSMVKNQPRHIIVSYAGGKLACYVDGNAVAIPNPPQGGLSNWTAQPLIFGDAWKGGRNWTGLMEDIGLFSRGISATEARQRFLKQRERTRTRKPAQDVVVDAKLAVRCPAADPAGIAPYRRCLSNQLYEVVKVISGTCADPKIAVAQWSVLDGKVVPSYEKLAVGQTCRLILESMDDHPEQESERTISGNFDANSMQLYYEVRAPDIIPAQQPATAAPQPGAAAVVGANVPGAVTMTDPKPDDLISKGTVRMAGQGNVAAATVVDGGFGYSQAPQVQFSGGGGQGAAGAAVMGVESLDITKVGSGYTSEPSVAIAAPDLPGGRTATATARIDKVGGTVSSLMVTDPGAGYLRSPQVTFTGGGGSGAEADAMLCLSGITVTNGGSGYTAPPAVTLDGGDGQGASAQAALQSKVFRFTGTSGNMVFTNAGTLEQEGSALVLDCATPQRPRDKFGFDNTGMWTLQKTASVQFTASSGHPDWVGYTNTNSGTMAVLDHSRLGFYALQNSGELELGEGAVLGQASYATRDNTLANTGILKVIGSSPEQPVSFGFVGPYSTGKRIIENGAAKGASQARFIIGSGKDTATFTTVGGQVNMTNFAGSSVEINPGAMLALITNDNGSTHAFNSRDAKVTSAGEFLLAGELKVQGNHVGFTGIENSGTLTISGDKAVAERLPNSTGPGGNYGSGRYVMQILNQPGGMVQGVGALNYVNSTDNNEAASMLVANMGTIAPGEAASGQAQESFGPLVLHNVNVRFGAAAPPDKTVKAVMPPPPSLPATPPLPGILRIGIGGPPNAAGRYDALTITGTDYFGHLELIKNEGNTLNVVTGAGYTPHGTYRIVTAVSVTGTFDTLQYNGAAQVPYTVNYLPDGIEVIFR